MSAAATAAGYLYASGRLRGKKDEEAHGPDSGPPRRRLRVAVLPESDATPAEPVAPRPKRVPRIEYRVRRWRPNE